MMPKRLSGEGIDPEKAPGRSFMIAKHPVYTPDLEEGGGKELERTWTRVRQAEGERVFLRVPDKGKSVRPAVRASR